MKNEVSRARGCSEYCTYTTCFEQTRCWAGQVDDDAESPAKSADLGRMLKGEPAATQMSSRSAAAAVKEECGPTSTSCAVSRLLAKISRPEGAGESKPTRVQAADGAVLQQQQQQQQQQPEDVGDSRQVAAGGGGGRAPATEASQGAVSRTAAAPAAAATAAAPAASTSKNKKKKKKKKTLEKPRKQQDQHLSPAEPPPVPKTQARTARAKKIPFKSSRPSLRDDPRRLLGNYGEGFAVDTDSSSSSGEEDEADGDEAEAGSDTPSPEGGTGVDSSTGGLSAVHLSGGGAMPTPPPARRPGLAPPDALQRKLSLDLVVGGTAPLMVAGGGGSCNGSSVGFSDAATSPAGPAGHVPHAAAAAMSGPAGFPPYATHTVPHGGFAYPAVSGDSEKTLHLEDHFSSAAGTAPPPPAAAPNGFGHSQHQHQHQHQKQRFLADETLAAAKLSGGSPRSSGYSTADVSLDDSLSPASPASRPVSPPSAQAAAAAAEAAVCYSPTSALRQPPLPPPPRQQQQQQERQHSSTNACMPSSAASLAAAVQAEARRRVDKMMGIPPGRDPEFQQQVYVIHERCAILCSLL